MMPKLSGDWKVTLRSGMAMLAILAAGFCVVAMAAFHEHEGILLLCILVLIVIAAVLTRQHFQYLKTKKFPSPLPRSKFLPPMKRGLPPEKWKW
jgi:ABC-type iron transport system FetAB permease component